MYNSRFQYCLKHLRNQISKSRCLLIVLLIFFVPNMKKSCQGWVQSTEPGGRIIFRSSFRNAQPMVCKSGLWIVRCPAPKKRNWCHHSIKKLQPICYTYCADHTKHVNLRKNAAGCLQVELNIQGCFMETTTYGQPRMAILWPYLQHST